MNAQQVQFAETIRAMKLALKRKPDDSDSDTPIHAPTNRGNKLKRRAKHVRAGRLDDTGGQHAYKKRVTHAGYERDIIATNPPLFDDDGDPYSPTGSDAEHGEPAAAAPLEDNAFGDVKLETALRPLTAAAELSAHPTLRVAYTSKALTQMAAEAQQMVRREKASLWKAKRLLQRFRGDSDWAPCGGFETEWDEMVLLGDGSVGGDVPSVSLETVGEVGAETVGVRNVDEGAQDGVNGDAMEGVEAADMAPAPEAELNSAPDTGAANGAFEAKEEEKADTNGNGAASKPLPDGTDSHAQNETIPDPPVPTNPALAEIARSLDNPPDPSTTSDHTSNSGKENQPPNGAGPRHTMTTRRRARSPQPHDGSPSPSDSSTPQIHPWFLPNPSQRPDKNLALPAAEAEETRKLLLLYVQKQENIVRGLEELYAGLQRGDRMRGEVWRACKAEGHVRDDGRGGKVTEMSDGEDWYDVEEWGMPEGTVLEKGKEEVEEGEEEGRRGGRRRVGRRI